MPNCLITNVHPENGRLWTAENVLSRTLEDLYPDARVIMAAFDGNRGRLEITTKANLRKTGKDLFERSVNGIIQRNLRVNTYFMRWEEASIEFDLSRLPLQIRRVRIIDIEGYDRSPCNDPHVENTSEIGLLALPKSRELEKTDTASNYFGDSPNFLRWLWMSS